MATCAAASQILSNSLLMTKPVSRLAGNSGINLVRSGRRAFAVRASSEEVSGTQKVVLEALESAKDKWDEVENKPVVFLYSGVAVLGLWTVASILGALDAVPLVPDFLKLVGTLYTGWFVYRYLLFEASRKELKETINSLKDKIVDSI